ncbi:septum formation protein Maf [Hydrogenophaga crassostreae]|uniref:dTTP/UTP pyrophosphatase n=1 Tax=Hydrogenophaga crassostreae TaxID=1763535 RepID=A0A167I380_9BURK|nr:Maf family protein [Hydrogenophaga crassostreae]AOW15613.1 septum formation inhibitor Maf [Hydrogenophaga crassostreae]OAD42076.1 septum formation protein Maf [Hydrogenophaga crassostreae]
MTDFIYLASQSPRRKQLLEQWGIRCELLLPDSSEDAEQLEVVLPGEAPAAYVQRVTNLKLEASLARLKRRGLPLAPVLCADTTVALGRRILGKPSDAADARAMLTDLAGKRHRVLTAVAVGKAVQRGAGRQWAALSTSWVHFEPLTAAQIKRYVDSGEPMGKAGAYAIQGQAALWASQINGSYSGIMGLPAFETAQVLASAGVNLL